MGSAQGGKHTNGGLNDVVQGIHLARLADARLEQSYLRLVAEQPNAQRNTDLRVIALGRTGDCHLGREQLIQPLLDHRLTIRTRNAHDRTIELVSVALSQSLKGCQR